MKKPGPTATVMVQGYSGGYARMEAGQFVRITDIEGGQVGDLFAISIEDHMEFLSPSVTRLYNLTLFPTVGQAFYSNRDRPMLLFVEDRSPGRHDMLMASCNKRMFEVLGMANHPNCRDNYFRAASNAGVRHTVKPDPVNFFQNTPVMPDGSIAAEATMSSPGDYVVLKAEMGIILILTACSTEMINHGKSSPLRIDIFDEPPE